MVVDLKRDHSMLDHLLGELERAARSGAGRDESLRDLDGIEAVMESHFRYEERELLDVLDGVRDETLTPGELFGPLA